MADYTRMRILWLLMEKEYCVGDLAKEIHTTESAVSHQLRELRIARLVCSRKVGKNVIYSLQDETTSNGFWKKPTHIFQSVKSAAPAFLTGAAPI